MSFLEGRGHRPDPNPSIEFLSSKVEAQLVEKEVKRIDRPHCENCTIFAQELAPGRQFMMCSNCKSKLDFVVQYCSK